MTWVVIVLIILIVCFGSVLLFGAPYMPTLKSQIEAALKLADAKPGETMLELGCGDGRVVIAAARRGVNVIGYELNPLLALIAWLRTRRFGRRVKIVWGDFWKEDWPRAEAIFVFLLPRYMDRLDRKIKDSRQKSVRLVSFAFQIPDRPPRAQQEGVYLYVYK
jgi:SAM-dependent methyltransferase